MCVASFFRLYMDGIFIVNLSADPINPQYDFMLIFFFVVPNVSVSFIPLASLTHSISLDNNIVAFLGCHIELGHVCF